MVCKFLSSIFAEKDELLAQDSEAAKQADMRDIFGATESDVNRLRIVSLHEAQFLPCISLCFDIVLDSSNNLPVADLCSDCQN